MPKQSTTRQELIEEISALRKRIPELEAVEAERRLAEENLAGEAARRRLLMEQSRDGIVILDQNGHVYESNRKFAEMLGYPLEAMCRLNVIDWECLHPPERVLEMISSVDEKGDHFETKHRRRDGSIYDVEISTNAAWFAGQKLIFCVCRDITKRKLAEERMALRQRELHEINQIGLIANSSLDLNVVLKLILQSATKAVNASVGMIFLKDPVSGCLTWGASIGLSEEFIHDFKNKPIQVGEGLTGTIAKTGEPIFILEDSSRDHRIVRSVIRKEGLNSFLGVPIIADEEIVGVMNILTRPPEQLSEQDVPFYAAIGSQIGFAIRNAQLYTAQKKAEEALHESETRFRSLFESMASGCCIDELIYDNGKPVDYRVLDVNPSYVRIMGIPRERAVGALGSQIYCTGAPPFLDVLANVSETGTPAHFETYFAPAKKYLQFTVSCPAKGLFSTVFSDITERTIAEQNLERVRFSVENLTDSLFWVGEDGCFIDFNDAACEKLGYSREKLMKMCISDIDPNFPVETWPVHWEEMKKRKSMRIETVHRTAKGEPIPMELTIHNQQFGNRRYNCVLGRDITERKRAEKVLRESEGRFQRMLGVVPDMISIHSPEMDILYSNWQGFAAVPEAKRILNTKCYKTYRDLDAICPDCRAKTVLDTQKPIQEETMLPDGTWVDLRVIPILDKDKNIEMFIEWVRNITDSKNAEEELLHQKVHFESLFTNTNDAIVFTDYEHRIININDQFTRLFGYRLDEIKGSNINEVVDPHGMAEGNYASQRFLYGEKVEMEAVRYRKSGDAIDVLIKGAPVLIEGRVVGGYAIYTDITSKKHFEAERERFQSQLNQAQKMEAIGTLAGGIAHDFNNILSAVMGYSEMAQAELPRESNAGRYIDQVLQASNRAKDLVKQILAFSRHSDEDMKPLKAELLLKEAVKLLRASLPSTIEIKTHISASRDTILANATQIHQVIMNLCTNAYHAMHKSGGVLDVSLSEVDLDGKAAAEDRHLSPGRYLLLGVSDTGCGMSLEVIERIFDPYFTTKEKDVGTGLGLSVVHGIVKRHGGDVRVWSEPGKGTEFHVLLPVLDEEVEVAVASHRDLPKGSGRILFVDDETPIADIGMRMLGRQGYDVEIKTSSLEALELFRSRPYDFDLLITDMTMPHLRGDALARAVMEIRPELPVILCTGYSDMIDEEKARELGIRCVLKKPVGLSELVVSVYDILSGVDPGRGEG